MRNFIHIDWRTDRVLPFRASVPEDGKPVCFLAVGEELEYLSFLVPSA